MTSRRARSALPLAALLLVALGLRVALVLATPDFEPVSDAADYDRYAQAIAESGGYPSSSYAEPGSPSALRPPAYPYLLAAVYEVTGRSWTAGRLAGAALGVLTVLLIYFLAAEMWNRRVGFAAAAIAAVYPPLVMVNGSLLSEALFLPLMLAAGLACVRYRRAPQRVSLVVAAGVLCGLAALTRSVGLALVLAAAVVVMTAGAPSTRQRVRAALVVVAAAVLVIAPWTVRNAIVLDAFVPLTTHAGPTAAGVYNGVANREGDLWGVWRVPFWLPEFRPLVRTSFDEPEIDREMLGAARRYAVDHPGYAVKLAGANTLRFFDLGPAHTLVTRTWEEEMGIPRSLHSVTTFSFYVVAAVAGLGLVALATRRLSRPAAPAVLVLFPALLYLSVVPVYGGLRYRIPIDPFVVLLAGVAVAPRIRPAS